MTKKTHSNNGKKINKVRLLLDDPFDADNIDTNDKYLTALQKRLTASSSFQHPSIPSLSKDKSDLSPRVIIHKQEQKTQVFQTSKEQPIQRMVYRIEIPQEALFEIEKILDSIPEFIEVKENKPMQTQSKEKPLFQIVEEPDMSKTAQEESLPKWEPVSEEEPPIDSEIEQAVPEPEEKIEMQEPPAPQTQPEIQDAFLPVRKTENKISKKTKEASLPHESFDEPDTWEPIEKKKENLTLKQKAEIFKRFASINQIDQEIALILYENGIKTIDELNKTSIETLETIQRMPSTLIQHVKKQQKKIKGKQTSQAKNEEENGIFHYNHYTLYKKEITIDDENKRVVHFFSKEEPEDGIATTLPQGYEVKVNRKTGVPFIKKTKQDDQN